ncbi:MAG TPA: hypothetical protein VGB27_04420 [Candidatus Binatia bacterium]
MIKYVTPAEAGVQGLDGSLDSRFHGNDAQSINEVICVSVVTEF